MERSDARRSLAINPARLRDAAKQRPRGSDGKLFSLITTKQHPTLPLEIHNYTDRAFMRKDSLEPHDYLAAACRTLITEAPSGRVVSRSFSKFFNYHERMAYKPTEKEYAFSVEEKVDGSIISLFWYANQWSMASRASFDSVHTQAARKILDKQYPRALSLLDKDKTYVFELVDPALPVHVIYHQTDLILLAIVSKDGREPLHGFDWSSLPFTRPKPYQIPSVNLKELSKLDRQNEEGFVVKFWQSPDDPYPQRIKVKLENYLQDMNQPNLVKPPSSIATRSTPSDIPPARSAPSNAIILETYMKHRLKIHHFNAYDVSIRMERHKQAYLQSLEKIADDYGGEPWLASIAQTWSRINALVSFQEDDWVKLISILERTGHKPKHSQNPKVAKAAFMKRVSRSDVDKGLRAPLLAWFSGEPPTKLVSMVMQGMEIPADLKTIHILLMPENTRKT